MSDTTFIQGGIDPVAYQELVEALAASEARERLLRENLRAIAGRLMNWAIDLTTGKKKHTVATQLAEVSRDISDALPDAPDPEKA